MFPLLERGEGGEEEEEEEVAVAYGRHLASFRRLELPRPLLAGVRLVVACDVDNPFVGPDGAVRVFGPQKGAAGAALERLESGMQRLAAEIARTCSVEVAAMPGAGAAGGIAGALCACCRADMKMGVAIIGGEHRLESRVQWADVVITGEGKYDAQTERGKVASEIIALARKHGKPALVVCGVNARADPPPDGVQVFATTSLFSPAYSMAWPAACLSALAIQRIVPAVPLLAAAAAPPPPRSSDPSC